MTVVHFIAQPAENGMISELEDLQPTNPFATASYFESMRQLGYSTWVTGLRHSAGGLESGCGAFLRRGRLNRTLEITSLPELDADSPFWEGLLHFCRRTGVTQLEIGTYASPPGTSPPRLGLHPNSRKRCEFVLDLTGDLDGMLSTNHRRNVKKGRKAGLTLQRTRAATGTAIHEELRRQSAERRRSRGELLSLGGAPTETMALLRSGVGELFQAICDSRVVSSVLVLRAAHGSYYHSAGTSPEGMSFGASHYLINEIACALKAEGVKLFNLGGADEDSTLARFKEGFGTSRVPLSSVSAYVGPSWRYTIGRTVHLLRSDPGALRNLVTGRWARMLVYCADPSSFPVPDSRAGLEFRALTQEELRTSAPTDPAFQARQLERLQRFEGCYAFGVFVQGQIAHVAWLLPPSAIGKDHPRVVPGAAGNAEITGCETIPEYRGRGVYGFAIRNLLHVAASNGFRRVFMKTGSRNHASRSGIEKAGLRRVGSAIIITLPLTHRQLIWRRFR